MIHYILLAALMYLFMLNGYLDGARKRIIESTWTSGFLFCRD